MSIARVFVNDVEVGSLPLGTYKAILSATKKDWRLYIAQALNFLGICSSVFLRTLMVIPAMLSVVLVISIFCFPSLLIENIAYLKGMPISDLFSGLRTFFWRFWFICYFGVLPITMFIPYFRNGVGFKNHFGAKIGREIRQLLEVPSEGDIKVIYVDPADDK